MADGRDGSKRKGCFGNCSSTHKKPIRLPTSSGPLGHAKKMWARTILRYFVLKKNQYDLYFLRENKLI